MELTTKPLSLETWDDFTKLFGPQGAYGGCWCMWWRSTRAAFEKRQGEENCQAMYALVKTGRPIGLIAYVKGHPVGWCSVSPREDFGSLERSRVLKRIDGKAVWSLVCFFIDRQHRGHAISVQLIMAAIDFVRSHKGQIVEAYPTIVRQGKLPPVSSYMGIPKIFEEAGFTIEKQASKAKLIMRYYL